MSSVKTILFLDSSLYGGIETHIVELVHLLKSNNINVEVLFFKKYNNIQLYRRLDDEDCPYSFLSGSLFDLFRYLKWNKNTVCLHTHGYKAGIIGRLTCKILNINCVSTFHAGEKGTGLVRLYNSVDKLTSFLSTNFVVSNKLKKEVYRAKVFNNFVKIPKHHHHESYKNIRVGFVGRLSHEKGPDTFIEIANSFTASDCPIEFHVYGHGPLSSELKQISTENVVFHGHQSDQRFWENIDILVICSRAEGLPMVLLESMAREICVISYDVGAVGKVIKHEKNGYLCQTNDIKSIRKLINDWVRLDDLTRDKIKRNAKQTIMMDFSGKAELVNLKNAYLNHRDIVI